MRFNMSVTTNETVINLVIDYPVFIGFFMLILVLCVLFSNKINGKQFLEIAKVIASVFIAKYKGRDD